MTVMETPEGVSFETGDAQRADAIARVCLDMLTDYLCCAEDKYIYSGRIDPFRDDMCKPILERIGGTRDGMRIRHHIERLRKLGVDA